MSLQLIVGSMFSGKSSYAIQLCKKLSAIDEKIIVVKPLEDIRYNLTHITTHDDETYPSMVVKELMSLTYIKQYKECNYIIIEEAQFFTDIIEFVTQSVDTDMKQVFVIGLDGDYDRKNFGDIHKLLPLCDSIKKLTGYCSVCKDGTKSIFSKRTSSSTKQIDIGEKDIYRPLCRVCYLML